MATDKMFLPQEWILDILDTMKVIILLVPCIMIKKSYAFPLLFELGYIKAVRNKCQVNLSISCIPSCLYLLSLTCFFLNPHTSPQAWTNILGGTQKHWFARWITVLNTNQCSIIFTYLINFEHPCYFIT